MWLSKLTVKNCRIVKDAKLEFNDKLNYIYGSNGSGKTSLLEAISILSLGRSFRTSRISEVISYGEDSLLCSSEVRCDDESIKRIGIEKTTSTTRIRVNRQSLQSQAQLSKILPVSIIHPLSHELISGGSSKRRRFLDWIAFYQFPEFHDIWKRYQQILKQRNASLKNPKLFYAIEHLTYELCELQAPIHKFRCEALEKLKQTMSEELPDFLLMQTPLLSLKTGLPNETPLDTEALVSYYNSKIGYEKSRGRTITGVHNADIQIHLNSKPAATSASRGQAKILSLLLHIAQNLTITQQGIIAIDDLAAEIDEKNYKQLIQFISNLERQTFITSTHQPKHNPKGSVESSMFHVKHGEIGKLL
ncbi:MAG: DNA replication and repair protein RecF [Thiotrichaceae bacterium]